MKATRNIKGQLKTYCALYDIAQTGEYEDDILRYDWLTEQELKARNEELIRLDRSADTDGEPVNARWVVVDVELEEHEDSPCLDMDLNY